MNNLLNSSQIKTIGNTNVESVIVLLVIIFAFQVVVYKKKNIGNEIETSTYQIFTNLVAIV